MTHLVAEKRMIRGTADQSSTQESFGPGGEI